MNNKTTTIINKDDKDKVSDIDDEMFIMDKVNELIYFFSNGNKRIMFDYLYRVFNSGTKYTTTRDILKNTHCYNKSYIYGLLDVYEIEGLIKKIRKPKIKYIFIVQLEPDLWEDINYGINKREQSNKQETGSG